jgi:hypothetical protein
LVTAPPAAWMDLMSGALSSGAVSSSWIWNLLTAVFTVNLLLVSGLLAGLVGNPLYSAFTWPLLYFEPLTYVS